MGFHPDQAEKVEPADYIAYAQMKNLGFQKRNFEANQGYQGVGDRSADEVVAISFDGKFNRDIIDNDDLRKCSELVAGVGRMSEVQNVVRYMCS